MFFSAIALVLQALAPVEGANEAGSSVAPWAHGLHVKQRSWAVLISEPYHAEAIIVDDDACWLGKTSGAERVYGHSRGSS
jgi:hypothetical protein